MSCHNDLLVTPDSRLALFGTVDVVGQADIEATATIASDDNVANSPTLKANVPHHLSSEPVQISPLTFIPCPRGPGRPKIKITRHGAASFKRKNNEEALIDPPAKKRRGRPPGSKKTITTATDDTRNSTNNTAHENFMYCDSDICNICHSYLNYPIKQHIKITNCI